MTINKFLYFLFVFTLFFGVIFYGFLQNTLHFTLVDELVSLVLFALYLNRSLKAKSFSKEFLYCILVMSFYLVYSFFLKLNVPSAVLMDFFIVVKPFVAFYCFYHLAPSFTKKQLSALNKISIFISFFLLVCSLVGLVNPSITYFFFGHISRFASATTIVALLYLYTSKRNKQSIIIFFLMLSIGLLSFRTKHYGCFTFAVLLFAVMKNLSKKNMILFISIFIPIVIFSGWDKLNFYFVDGMQSSNIYARPALYMGALDILQQYFPFGSGYGSYASFASAVYMSPLYSNIRILSYSSQIQDGMFLCDAFFPQLAQFGIVGVFLFAYFWKLQLKKSYCWYKQSENSVAYKAVIFIMSFFFIESVADTTFVQNRGLFMMMLLALWMKNLKNNRI